MVVATHGMGDHGGGLGAIGDRLVSQGYAYYAHDLRGHGKSPGQRGHFDRWSDLLEDLGALIGLARAQEPQIPLILLGHSMGGLLTLDYALAHPGAAHGVVAISPAVALGMSPWLMRSLGLLALLRPTMSIRTTPNFAELTRDEAAARRLAADTLRTYNMSPRLGSELWRAHQRVGARAAELRAPLLMLYGDADPITPAAGIGRFFEAAGSPSKQRHVYPGAVHRPFEDLCGPQMLDHLQAWLDNLTK